MLVILCFENNNLLSKFTPSKSVLSFFNSYISDFEDKFVILLAKYHGLIFFSGFAFRPFSAYQLSIVASEVEVLNLCKNRGRLVLHSVGSEKIAISQN